MLQGSLQDGAPHGPWGKVFGCRLTIERRRPTGLCATLQALPPHVGPLSLEHIFFKQHELHSGKSILEGALGFPRLPRWGLRRPLALGMESIGIDRVYDGQILCHRLRSGQGELAIFLLITGARVTAHSDPVSRVVSDEQGGDLVDLLLTGRVEEPRLRPER